MDSRLLAGTGLCLICLLTRCALPPMPSGAVSAASPEAVEAGLEILDKGGNAVDAAVAVALSLNVTEPAMSGVGGGIQMIISEPGRVPLALNGTTYASSGLSYPLARDDLRGLARSTVPSSLKALDHAWRHYGSRQVDWAELCRPAIKQAEDGYEVGWFRHKVYRRYGASALAQCPSYLTEDGRIPGPGEQIANVKLAKFFKVIAEKGAEEFYSGSMVQDVVQDMDRHGGGVTAQDLRSFPDPTVSPALHVDFRGHRVYTSLPPTGGWAVLYMLDRLNDLPRDSLLSSSQDLHRLRALQEGHQVRERHPLYQSKDAPKEFRERLQLDLGESGETTHYSVVDREGMMVSVTASINAYFGARIESEKWGFLYNSYMTDFDYEDSTHVFHARPANASYSSMSPTVVRYEGTNVLAIGSPGSARIMSTVAQLIQRWTDEDLSLEHLVALPRIHVVDDQAYLEAYEPALATRLQEQGWTLAFPAYDLMMGGRNAYFGGVHAVGVRHGKLEAAADPRRDGAAKVRHAK